MAQVGVVGLAVMGKNLAFNIAEKGFKVAVYNRRRQRTDTMMAELEQMRAEGAKMDIIPTYSPEELCRALERPRKIILMVKAGKPVDAVIDSLLPYLEPGDLLIDGGNSYYLDTERRLDTLSERGILYLGMGVSGGERGARFGPSLMPGGTKDAYELVREILESIAARGCDGPCCAYVGDRSAGHFVKMTHNAIEYAIMQMIAEVYHLLSVGFKLSAPEISEIFHRWNEGQLRSFLIEITYKVLRYLDRETGKYLVDLILDRAEQKGTGRWAAQAALELGVPTPTLTQAVIARTISSFKEYRVRLAQYGPERVITEKLDLSSWLTRLERALQFGFLCAFSQGIWLMVSASETYNYNLNLTESIRIWKDGCIIRANMLDLILELVSEGMREDIPNPLLHFKVLEYLNSRESDIKSVVKLMIDLGLPVQCLGSALDYYQAMTTKRLPANLIQAQRDMFGAHTYQRVDKEGYFHTEWDS